MNLLFFLAQITPAVDKSATVIASFWNTPLGILVVVALIAILAGGLALGLRAQTKTPQSPQESSIMSFVEKLFGDFTNVLAWLVIILAFIGIFVLCYVVLKPTTNKDTAQYVFGAVLPLLGTWVGAVLAHYFQKENLAAATQSISDLASKVTGTDKLKSTPVKTVMIRPDRIDTLPDNLLGKADDEIKLSELVTYLDITIKRDRLPIFKDNKKTGPANRVLHRSIIERFITKQALMADEAGKPKLDAAQIANLTLADAMNDKELVMRLLNNSDICILAKGRFPGSLDLSQNLLSFSPPDVPLGIEVMLGEVLHDSVHQLAHAAEAAGQNRLLAQVSEEAFDQIHPG